MYAGTDIDGNKIRITLSPLGCVLAIVRICIITVTAILCLFTNLLVRLLIELPFFAPNRPFSMHITRFFARLGLVFVGIRCEKIGTPTDKLGIVVSNHLSWLDILPLLKYQNGIFASKNEVKYWPILGQMVWAAGTVFIKRSKTDAAKHHELFEQLLAQREKIIFFPEGSSYGLGVLPFKPTLFEALFTSPHADMLYVQPVTLTYITPKNLNPAIYCWGRDNDIPMLKNILLVFGQFRQARVQVIFSDALKVTDYPNRKAIAKAAEDIVRTNFEANKNLVYKA